MPWCFAFGTSVDMECVDYLLPRAWHPPYQARGLAFASHAQGRPSSAARAGRGHGFPG